MNKIKVVMLIVFLTGCAVTTVTGDLSKYKKAYCEIASSNAEKDPLYWAKVDKKLLYGTWWFKRPVVRQVSNAVGDSSMRNVERALMYLKDTRQLDECFLEHTKEINHE